MAQTDMSEDFRAADLIGSAGVGANGEKLVATLDFHYPPELIAAQLRRRNEFLTQGLTPEHLASIAAIAGVDRVDHVTVRGGERRLEDARITYAYVNDRDDVTKGAMPYSALETGAKDGHISQRDSILESPAARDHAEAVAKQRAAEPRPVEVDPFAVMSKATAGALVRQMEEHPERIEAIKAFERATRGDKARPSVIGFEPEASASAERDAAADDAAAAENAATGA